jgi:SAM-dependent MidA family methyltransferase
VGNGDRKAAPQQPLRRVEDVSGADKLGLKDRLKKQIKMTGPISVADYWAQCLFDPKDGYYMSREPFGVSGDFTTAPEISQMFGEMLAVWWFETAKLNEIKDIALVEIGPGRGTLMSDMLRTIAKLDPGTTRTLEVHMVETSERLALLQRETLKSIGFSITWHKTTDTLPTLPLGIIANELFDAIPIRQFVKTGKDWQERCIGLNDNGRFCFVTGPAQIDRTLLPKNHEDQQVGTIFEHSPARESFMQQLADRIQQQGGFGLFIDYGHGASDFGDTLQALKKHKFISVLEGQGTVDITSHVDFESLSTIAKNSGLAVSHLMNQGDFLLSLGIENRLERLIAARPDQRDSLVTAFDRLTKSDEMGSLFKVLGISHPFVTLPILQISS